MKILALESSCDETAAAVVENGRTVLSSVVATQIEEHKRFGGVVPEIASRMHTESICAVTEQALADADCTLSQIDAIAVTYAPGLIGALLVERQAACTRTSFARAYCGKLHHAPRFRTTVFVFGGFGREYAFGTRQRLYGF